MTQKHFKQLGLFAECDPSIKVPKEATKWTLFTDGASRRNPGPSGAGIYIMKNEEPFFKKGVFLGTKTNNQAEYLALVLGIYYIKKNIEFNDALFIMSDSELLIRQMKGEYQVKNKELKQLFQLSHELLQNIHHSFCHVLREYNKEADSMANHGIDSKVAPPQTFLALLRNHELQI